MLEKIDLTKKLGKKKYKQIMPELSDRLSRIQKASCEAGIAVVILFEGWDAAGKGASIQKLTSSMDPRGFKVYPIGAPRAFEKKRPWMWRYWMKLPGRGEWVIFDRSWYRRITNDRLEGIIPENEWRRGYRDIVDFERTLVDNEYVLIKFFLHLGRQEQRRRFNKLSSDPQTAWRVTPQDWERHRRYDDWAMAWEEVFDRTDTEWAPWTIIGANNRRFAWVKIYQTIMDVFAESLEIPQISQLEQISSEPSQASVLEAFQNADSLEPIILTGSGSSKPDESVQTTVEKYPVELENPEKDI